MSAAIGVGAGRTASVVDLRSDTVTRPTDGMWEAMRAAALGDDVFGDDPTVRQLEERIAHELGFEAALFVPTGTQSNLCALLSHCARGEEYIAGQSSHAYRWEAGGAAVLGGIQPQPLDELGDGTIDLAAIAAAIKPDDVHFARTRLIVLENTSGGRVLPLDYLRAVQGIAKSFGLATHLDGARLFNAAVAGGVSPMQITRGFDSVSVCFSKGLGAPAGSALCASRDLIDRARRWRKMLGGGMRQSGVLAAAAIYALDHHLDRLSQDHARARQLANAIAMVPQVTVDVPESNMVFVNLLDNAPADLTDRLAMRGVLVTGKRRLRLVTHLDVSETDVEHAGTVFREILGGRNMA